ncbi:hypothetical protein ACWECC_21805, partial [Streptomyces microflavus]
SRHRARFSRTGSTPYDEEAGPEQGAGPAQDSPGGSARGGPAGGGGTAGPGTLSALVPRTPRVPSSSMNHCPLDLPVRPLPRSI